MYALLYREQIKRLKNDIQDIAGQHPLRKVLKFMGQVAFFGQNDDVDAGKQGQVSPIYQFPEELNFKLEHVATLISSLQHEDSLEIDLLEKWTEFLTEIEPEVDELDFDRTIQSYTDILESVACLLEREKQYPNSLLNLLAQYSIR